MWITWLRLTLVGLTVPLSMVCAYHTIRWLGLPIGAGHGSGTVGLLLVPLVTGGYLALCIYGVVKLPDPTCCGEVTTGTSDGVTSDAPV